MSSTQVVRADDARLSDARTPLTHTHTSSQITDFATAVPAAVPASSETAQGKIEIATTAEVTTGTDDARAITPLKLAQRIAAIPAVATASETVAGIVELATAAETATGTDNTRAVHPAGLKPLLDAKAPLSHTHTSSQITDFSTAVPAAVPAASETVQGKVELATAAETTTGTDSTRAVHPLGLKAATDLLIPKALVDAKGDLIAATADNVPARLPIGTDGQQLIVDSTQATGMRWSTPAGGGVGDATTTTKGVIKLAGDLGGTADLPTVVQGTETVAGKLELATTTEATTGTDTTRAVHPAGLKAVADLLIPRSGFQAKGDMIVGAAAGVVARLPVGVDGAVLKADSTSGTGVRWYLSPPLTKRVSTTGQAVTTSLVAVDWTTGVSDPGDFTFSTATDRFTCVIPGTYRISSHVGFTAPAADSIGRQQILVNATTEAEAVIRRSSSQALTCFTQCTKALVAGDIIEVQFTGSTASGTLDANPFRTFIEIVRETV